MLPISSNLPLLSRPPLTDASRDMTQILQSRPTRYQRTRFNPLRNEDLDTTRESHSELGAAVAILGTMWGLLRSVGVELSTELTNPKRWRTCSSFSRVWNKFLRRPLEFVVSLLFSAFCVGIFVAESSANVMSANIVTDTTALVSSSKCGIEKLFNRHSDAAAYSKKCYQTPFGEDGCNSFHHQSVEYTEKSEDKCPFPGETCALEKNPAFSLDTGMVDAKIIGINSRSGYQFRRTTTCAPLRPDGEFLKGKRYDRSRFIGGSDLDYDFYGRLKTLRMLSKDNKSNTLGQSVSLTTILRLRISLTSVVD